MSEKKPPGSLEFNLPPGVLAGFNKPNGATQEEDFGPFTGEDYDATEMMETVIMPMIQLLAEACKEFGLPAFISIATQQETVGEGTTRHQLLTEVIGEGTPRTPNVMKFMTKVARRDVPEWLLAYIESPDNVRIIGIGTMKGGG